MREKFKVPGTALGKWEDGQLLTACRICLKGFKALKFQTNRIAICVRCVNTLNESPEPAIQAQDRLADMLARGMLRNAHRDLESDEEWKRRRARQRLDNFEAEHAAALPGWLNKLLADPKNNTRDFKILRAHRRGLLRLNESKSWDYPGNWTEVAWRIRQDDDTCCATCRKTDTTLDVHHIVYLSNFGTNQKNNLVTLCRSCHEREHGRILDPGEADEPRAAPPVEAPPRTTTETDEAIAELQAQAEAQARKAENARRFDAQRRAAEAEADDRRRQALERAHQAQLETYRHEELSVALGSMLNTPASTEIKSIDVQCVNCKTLLTIDAARAGLRARIRCPVCQHVFMPNEPSPRPPPRPPAPITKVNALPNPDTLVLDGGRTGRHVTQGTKTAVGNIKSQTATNVAVGLLGALLIAAYFINQPSQLVQPTPSTTTSKPTPKAFDPPSPTSQTVEAVAAQALVDYPYLSTSAGDKAAKLIVTERDRRISQGVSPPVALKEAVEQIAPKHDPRRHGKSARQ